MQMPNCSAKSQKTEEYTSQRPKIKDNKKSLHTQVYTVEMGKYTKINKKKKNKLQGKWTDEQYPCNEGAAQRGSQEPMVRQGATWTGSAFRIRRKL